MPIDVEQPKSPGWWLDKLSKKLEDQRNDVQDLFDRFEGENPLPPSLNQAPETAKRLFRTAQTRFAEMIVKAVRYPLKIQAISTAAEPGVSGDPRAWEIFRTSGMEEECPATHSTSLVSGRAYAIVMKHDVYGPRYTSEDPREVVTIQDPVVQSETRAAMKITHDDIEDRDYCWLYLPGRVYRCSKESKNTDTLPQFTAQGFEWDEEYGGENGLEIPDIGNKVPVFAYRNEEGVGEFERHLNILDRIDHMILQGMVIATFQAFKQRGIMVNQDDMPNYDPETGEEIDYSDIFAADPGALWILPETAKMWESGAVDLTPVWTGVDRDIQKLSAVTFTPLAMFSPEGQNQSAEGATFAREGRTFKIEDRQELFGRIHEKALSMLMEISNEPERAKIGDLKIYWKPAERHSMASRAAAMNQTRGDLPFKTRAIQIWQASPAEALEMERQRDRERMLEAAMSFDADLAPKETTSDPKDSAPTAKVNPETGLSKDERRQRRQDRSRETRGLSTDG